MGYGKIKRQSAMCQRTECVETEDYIDCGSKTAKKKWVKAGGILLAVLLTACGGEQNAENDMAQSSVARLDNIRNDTPEASDSTVSAQGVDEKDSQIQSSGQQEDENAPSRQSGEDPGAQSGQESGDGSGAQSGQESGDGSGAQSGQVAESHSVANESPDAASSDAVPTPEPAKEPIEEKLTPEGIGWGLSFGESGTQPVGNASPRELALYDAYFMKEGDEKVIYLTFDCGYENGNTEKILDALKAHNAPATFFVVGHFLETEPEIVSRMVEEGHAVGNHTYHHYDINTLDADSFQKELEDVENLFKEITGEELSPYYRPPEGKCGTTNLKLAQDLGYTTCFWSLAYVDWDPDKQPTHKAALDKLTARIHPGAIVLLHNTSQTNGEILDELLTKWEEMGYTFAPLSDLSD